MRWLVLLALLFGCATPKKAVRDKASTIKDKRLAKIVKKFEYFYGKKIKTPIKIGLIYDGNTPRVHATGVCHTIKNEITLNSLRWKKLNYLEAERLVFHELGHCELRRGHPDHYRKYNMPEFLEPTRCPKSIMNSGTTWRETGRKMTDICYALYYDYYIMELFANKRIRRHLL